MALRSQPVITTATVLAIAATVLLTTPASAEPSPPPGPITLCSNNPPVHCIENKNYVGWSKVADNSQVNGVDGTFTVPTPKCDLGFFKVSVWAGLWGTIDPKEQLEKSWLPQIGVLAQCSHAPLNILPSAVWSMPHPDNGKAYLLRNGQWIEEQTTKGQPITDGLEGLPVSQGDTMRADVRFLGSDADNTRYFNLTLMNVTQNQKRLLEIKTSPGVDLLNITRQGGIILEKEDYSLPRFEDVKVTDLRVDFRVSPSQYWFNKWLMPDATATDLKDGSFVVHRSGG